MSDVVRDMGPAFLGSRLKRLGERMQAGAAEVISQAGLPLQPGQMAVLAALRTGPMTIGQLAETCGASQPGVTRTVGQLEKLGILFDARHPDQRARLVQLTAAGQDAARIAATEIWPRVGAAAQQLLDEAGRDFMRQLSTIEAALECEPIDRRAARIAPVGLRILEFDDALAGEFHDINAEWIDAMFVLEDTDREVLRNPRERIVDPGGTILFVEAAGLGIVGTCALQKTGQTSYELTKMGVRSSARGLKAGEFLLARMIERAVKLGADPLYLLTNHKCEAAIHLYEKLGFVHDAEIMEKYAKRYRRCDVAMRFCGPARN